MLLISTIIGASLFMKLTVFVLIALAVWSWGLFAEKLGVFKVKSNMAESFHKEYSSGEMLDKIYNRLYEKERIHAPNARLFFVGMKELTASNIKNIDFGEPYADGVKQNIRTRMQMAISVERAAIISEMRLGIASLASVAAIAPFIGLFGTIMEIVIVFQSAAQAAVQSPDAASLIQTAFVTSGIAQSMVSTAFGIAVSIPAVIFYNLLISKLNALIIEYESFGHILTNTLSRELDLITSNTHSQRKQIR